MPAMSTRSAGSCRPTAACRGSGAGHSGGLRKGTHSMTPNNARESPKSRQGQRAVGAEIRTSKAKTATPTVESSGPVVAADPELSAEAAKARRAEAAGSSTFPGAACFVGVVWVVLMAATLMLIYQHHTCVPYVEDWSLFPVVVGEQPINLPWL